LEAGIYHDFVVLGEEGEEGVVAHNSENANQPRINLCSTDEEIMSTEMVSTSCRISGSKSPLQPITEIARKKFYNQLISFVSLELPKLPNGKYYRNLGDLYLKNSQALKIRMTFVKNGQINAFDNLMEQMINRGVRIKFVRGLRQYTGDYGIKIIDTDGNFYIFLESDVSVFNQITESLFHESYHFLALDRLVYDSGRVYYDRVLGIFRAKNGWLDNNLDMSFYIDKILLSSFRELNAHLYGITHAGNLKPLTPETINWAVKQYLQNHKVYGGYGSYGTLTALNKDSRLPEVGIQSTLDTLEHFGLIK
jgi:hypothetical protein